MYKNQNDEKKKLQHYLAQFKAASIRQQQLKKRHDLLSEDLKVPLQGSHYGSMPTNTNVPSAGAASILFRIAEIEEMIREQTERAADICLRVMTILDFLPDASDERLIMELRYIDGMDCQDIAENTNFGRTTCYRIEQNALDILLGFDWVRDAIGVGAHGSNHDC